MKFILSKGLGTSKILFFVTFKKILEFIYNIPCGTKIGYPERGLKIFSKRAVSGNKMKPKK